MKSTIIHHAQRLDEQEEERALWLFRVSLHGEDRLWWSYFQDTLEIHTCLTAITRSFPCLKLLSLQPCPHGLRICSHSYPALCPDPKQSAAIQQDDHLFPLAPLACDHLASFVKSLGDAPPCEQCQTPALT